MVIIFAPCQAPRLRPCLLRRVKSSVAVCSVDIFEVAVLCCRVAVVVSLALTAVLLAPAFIFVHCAASIALLRLTAHSLAHETIRMSTHTHTFVEMYV